MQRLTVLLLTACLACFTIGCGGKTGKTKTPAGDSAKTPPAGNNEKTKTPAPPQDC